MKQYFEKFQRRNVIFAYLLLSAIVVLTVACGGWAIAGGLAVAMSLPALTDKETEFLAHVKGELNKELEKFEKGYISKTKLEELIAEKLLAVKTEVQEGTVSKSEYDSLKETVEEQGLKIKEYDEGGIANKGDGTIVKWFKSQIEKGGVEQRNYSASTKLSAKDILMEVKAAALMTTANVTPETANGFSPLFGNYIDTELGGVPKPDPVMMPLISVVTQPGTEKIYYSDRVNEEGDAAFIAEGSLKPLADAEWVTASAPVEEVAVRWKHTKRLANHAPSVVSDFREHVNELLELEIDDNLVAGGGVTPNLSGVEDLASAFVCPTALANYYASANVYDAIMAIATQVRLANFKGSLTCMLNTVYQAQLAGIKNANNDYIIPPFVTKDGKQVGEVKIVFTNQVLATKITVGDLKKFKVVMAEDVEYDEGYENDDFSKNLVSKKLEAYMGTYMRASDAGSIVTDDIATVLAAILKP